MTSSDKEAVREIIAPLATEIKNLSDNIKVANSNTRESLTDLYNKNDQVTDRVFRLETEIRNDINKGFESLRAENEKAHSQMSEKSSLIDVEIALIKKTLADQENNFNKRIALVGVALTIAGFLWGLFAPKG